MAESEVQTTLIEIKKEPADDDDYNLTPVVNHEFECKKDVNNLVKEEPTDDDYNLSPIVKREFESTNDLNSQNLQKSMKLEDIKNKVKLENFACKKDPDNHASILLQESGDGGGGGSLVKADVKGVHSEAKVREGNVGSNIESEHYQEESGNNSKLFMKLQTSKYPIVLVEKLNNLHYGIGYDVKLYEPAPVVDNDRERVMEQVFSQFILTISKDEFKCSACGYVGKNKPHAIRHSLIHSDVKLYKCVDCNYESNRKDKYKIHLEKKHNTPFFECKICDFATSRKDLMDKHNSSHQSQKINWRKKKRKRSKPNSSSNQVLLKTGKKKRKNCGIELSEYRFSEITRYVDGDFICAICDYKTKSRERAQRHSMVHTNMWYLCSECDCEFIGRDVYEAHIKDYHENKSLYKCSDCNFSSNQKKEYDSHVSSHAKESQLDLDNMEKVYSCEECDYKTRYQNHLVRHNRVHFSHKNPSKRKVNSKNSNPSKAQLNKYLDDFTDSVIEVSGHLYKCTLCPYVSVNKHHTRRHSLIHSEKKLYKCTDCKFASNRKDKCKEHIRKIHPDKLEGSSTSFRKSSSDSISECSNDTEGSNSISGSKKLFQCYECSFQTMFRSHLSKHQLRHTRRKEVPGFDVGLAKEISGFDLSLVKEENPYTEIDDKECETNINSISDVEDKLTLPLMFNTAELVAENIKTEDAKPFMIGHIKSEPPEFLTVDDGIVDAFHIENKFPLVNSISESQVSVLDNQQLSNDDKLLQCLDCNFTTYDEKCLGSHLCCKGYLNNENKKLFTCTECTYTTFRLKQLAAHIVAHSSLKSFKCTECDFQTIYRNNLKTHLLTHTDIKLFNCVECSYQTNYKSHLKKHQTVHKKKKTNSLENHSTEHSNNFFINGWAESATVSVSKQNSPVDESIGNPQLTLNTENRKLLCTKCPYICSNEIELKEHLFSHFTNSVTVVSGEISYVDKGIVNIEESRIENGSQGYQAIISDNLVPMRLEAEIQQPHSLESESQMPHRHETESQAAQMVETLNQVPQPLQAQTHVPPQRQETQNQDPNFDPNGCIYSCTQCDFKANKKTALRKHAIVHSTVLYKCPQCNFKTKYRSNLKPHLQTHMVDKLFKCSVCSYETNYKKNMSKHLQTHSDAIKVEKNQTLENQTITAENQQTVFPDTDFINMQTQVETALESGQECSVQPIPDFVLWTL